MGTEEQVRERTDELGVLKTLIENHDYACRISYRNSCQKCCVLTRETVYFWTYHTKLRFQGKSRMMGNSLIMELSSAKEIWLGAASTGTLGQFITL